MFWCVLANCVCVLALRMCMYYICEETHLSAQSQLLNAVFLCPFLYPDDDNLERTLSGRRMQWLAKLADVCVCVSVCASAGHIDV